MTSFIIDKQIIIIKPAAQAQGNLTSSSGNL